MDTDQAVVDAINAHTGAGLTRTGRAEAGTLGGAIFVDLPDGGPAVVTRFLGSVADARRTASVMEHAGRRGLPVPLHHLTVSIGEDVVVVQQRVPGAPPTKITRAVIDAIVEINDRFADVLSTRPDVPTLPLCLIKSGDPYPRHEILAEHSDRSRRVLEAIRSIGRQYPQDMTGNDLLHIDLTAPNILFDQSGKITGVVDWNLGAYRGDRHLALIKTRFELEWGLQSANPDPETIAVAEHLDKILSERVSEQNLQRYWAHRMLYQLYWTLLYGPPEVIDWHLEVAEAGLKIN